MSDVHQFRGSFLKNLLGSPSIDGTVLKSKGGTVDFAAGATTSLLAHTLRYMGIPISRKLIAITKNAAGKKVKVALFNNGKPFYRPEDIAALATAMRANPTNTALADKLEELTAGTVADRKAYFARVGKR